MGKDLYDVVVLGSGILGLATADALTTAGLRVAVVGRDLPEDLDSAAFASPWAGANWSSFAANDKEKRRDTISFQKFEQLAKTHPSMFTKREFNYIWNKDIGYSSPWYKDLVGDFGPMKESDVPKPYTTGVTFKSFTLNPPLFLAYLADRLRTRGVPIIRKRVASLDEAYTICGAVSFVVNATGLGARTLLGVEDAKVFPSRGQTVLARAPGVQICYGVRDANLPKGEGCYIIPRPGTDGCVILGGTALVGEYDTLVRRETAERILKNAYQICPALAGPNGKSWRDIEIVSHNVGLRPMREGGLRLEIEERELGGELLVPTAARVAAPRKVAVLHCYGIGPAGYQASLGVADEAKDLVTAYLAKSAQGRL